MHPLFYLTLIKALRNMAFNKKRDKSILNINLSLGNFKMPSLL